MAVASESAADFLEDVAPCLSDELELQESNNHLKALNQFYGKLSAASEAMNNTAEDANRAKEQITALANNLTKLNQVYGSMLTAMQGR